MKKMRKLISKLLNFIFIVVEFLCKNCFKLCLKIFFKRYIMSFISIIFITWFIDINVINDILFSNDNTTPKTSKPNEIRKIMPGTPDDIEWYVIQETPEEKAEREKRFVREMRHIYIQLERIGIFKDQGKNNIFHRYNLENMYDRDENDFTLEQEEELDALRMKLKDALNQRGFWAFMYCFVIFYIFDQYTRELWERFMK